MANIPALKSEQPQAAGDYYMIARDKIAPFPEQPRKWFDPKGLEELADSIQQDGQETPLKVTTDNNMPGQFILISGERRWRAGGIIQERIQKSFALKAIVEIVTDAKEHFKKSFLENMHREDMWALDVAEGLKRMKTEGATYEELAKMSGKSVPYITNYIRLVDLPDDIKSMMHPEVPKDRRLRTSHAIEISRVKDPTIQREIAMETIERNLPIRDTKVLVMDRARKTGAAIDLEGREGLVSRRDNGRLFSSFLGRADKQTLSYLQHTDFEQMYVTHSDDRAAADTHKATIDRIIRNLEKMRDAIDKARSWDQSL
ncbi:MAG: ParB/RepB/Spo0J family partition protein [Candidatus Paceibacterota bacterium]